ncbi:hypothetical protein [Pseudonocardia sp. ICBG1293]|uniref:hypothetical protein n=1 Tax=Pseudonocardia sp. ICBG1293 TaxID=2844382 RepID=UPI001CCEAD40|nr:hypothetical protein [Pseudonocardia sp. ICBG1293]
MTPTGPAGGDPSGIGVARDEGAAVGRAAVDAGAHVAGAATDEVRQVARETGRQARDLLDEARHALGEQAGSTQRRAAGGVRGLADELRRLSGDDAEGPVADLARDAAGRAERLAGWLEEREPGDVVDQVRGVARRHPGTFLAGAVDAGVLVGRLTRGAVDRERTPRPDPTGGHDVPPSRPVRSPAEHPGAPTPVAAPTTVAAPAPVAAPGTPWSAPAAQRGEDPGAHRAPGSSPDDRPAPAPAAPFADGLLPAPPPPAHAPRPGATTVGEYVDELGRRGDPRIDEDPR